MSKKLYISLVFSNLVVIRTLSSNHRMHNLYTKFVKILEICKQFSENLVNESGNVPRRGPVPKFLDLEVVALSLTVETESIDEIFRELLAYLKYFDEFCIKVVHTMV